jgi:hypothetical protein
MYQNTIAWMIAGGTDTETIADRRHREQLIALRASAGTERTTARVRNVRALVARWNGRTVSTTDDLTLDCCAA